MLIRETGGEFGRRDRAKFLYRSKVARWAGSGSPIRWAATTPSSGSRSQLQSTSPRARTKKLSSRQRPRQDLRQRDRRLAATAGHSQKADHDLRRNDAVATSTPLKSRNAGAGISAEAVARSARSTAADPIAPERTFGRPSIEQSMSQFIILTPMT